MKKNTSLNRRKFLRNSLLSSGAFLLLQGVSASSGKSSKPQKAKIQTRKLGNTGIEIPVVSVGKLPYANPRLTEEAYNLGIRYFDTALRYDDGKHEEMLGQTLNKFKRDTYYLGTKVSLVHKKKSDDSDDSIFDSEEYIRLFESCLKRLQTDYVDILFVHGVKNPELALDTDVITCLQSLKDRGLTKHIGMSTHANEPAVLQAAINSNFYEIVLSSYNFTQLHNAEMEEKIKAAGAKGIGILAMKVMAGGFLDKEKTKPVNYLGAMKWALKNTFVCSLVMQTQNFDQLEKDATILFDSELTPEELKDLEANHASATLYCDACGICIGQCTKALEIPDIMRSYMYSYGYSDHQKAKSLLSKVISFNSPCAACPECTVKCPKGFQVSEKITDISRILAIPDEFLA